MEKESVDILFHISYSIIRMRKWVSEAEVQSGSAGKIEELEVHFIDVGQGDATLVKCGGQSMLIDAGKMIKALLYRIILGNRV